MPNTAKVNEIRMSAVNALRAESINRIVQTGTGSNNQQLGVYSTKPAYFSKDQFINKGAFRPEGKRGKKADAKSMFLPQGYQQLRAIQGREAGFVNQEYTGALNKDYQQQLLPDGTIITGFTNSVQIAKKRSLEKRFGQAYPATQQELDRMNARVAAGYKTLVESGNV